MTSLEAAIRFSHQLTPADIQGLIADALHRLTSCVYNLEQAQQQDHPASND
jgi:hypothetical protein